MKCPITTFHPPPGGPAPHGAGGLKYDSSVKKLHVTGPAPHGAGGLKYHGSLTTSISFGSRPARGGWIEII